MAEHKTVDGKLTSDEAQFRDGLRDVVAITERLAPYCSSVKDLTEMAALALENDGQLRALMKLIAEPGKR